MKKHVIDGIDVELDDDIDPTEVEAFGADSRTDDAIDLEQLEAQAVADAAHAQPDEDEGVGR